MAQQKITGAQVSISLDDITDVSVGTPVIGQVLRWDGSNWVPGAGAPTALVLNTQAGDYTLQLTDASNTLIRITKASAALVTIPNDSTTDFPVGSAVLISWNGTGAVSIAGEAGVTIDTPDTLNIGKRYGKVTAIKVGANHWEIEGNLEPA